MAMRYVVPSGWLASIAMNTDMRVLLYLCEWVLDGAAISRQTNVEGFLLRQWWTLGTPRLFPWSAA